MAKNIAASHQKKPGGLSDKVSDIVLVVICAAVMLIVAYPLYYVLVASFSDPYDVYAGIKPILDVKNGCSCLSGILAVLRVFDDVAGIVPNRLSNASSTA